MNSLPAINFHHTADIHLGKTYRTSAGEAARYEDFFHMLGSIVSDAIAEKVDFVGSVKSFSLFS